MLQAHRMNAIGLAGRVLGFAFALAVTLFVVLSGGNRVVPVNIDVVVIVMKVGWRCNGRKVALRLGKTPLADLFAACLVAFAEAVVIVDLGGCNTNLLCSTAALVLLLPVPVVILALVAASSARSEQRSAALVLILRRIKRELASYVDGAKNADSLWPDALEEPLLRARDGVGARNCLDGLAGLDTRSIKADPVPQVAKGKLAAGSPVEALHVGQAPAELGADHAALAVLIFVKKHTVAGDEAGDVAKAVSGFGEHELRVLLQFVVLLVVVEVVFVGRGVVTAELLRHRALLVVGAGGYRGQGSSLTLSAPSPRVVGKLDQLLLEASGALLRLGARVCLSMGTRRGHEVVQRAHRNGYQQHQQDAPAAAHLGCERSPKPRTSGLSIAPGRVESAAAVVTRSAEPRAVQEVQPVPGARAQCSPQIN
eukprot:m.50998 g.50998  ORF g.50998 m.50998 type:complete len:425 (-) comp6579_c0_seq1:108-1382(-)